MFSNGRTETIRSFSLESKNFVESFCLTDSPGISQLSLLSIAIEAHLGFIKSSTRGQGFDRHLLALRLLLREGESHPIFEDELFERSQRWRLSTSGLHEGEYFDGTGFGAVREDGFGVAYMVGKNGIRFGVECKERGGSEKFAKELVMSLRRMKEMVERGKQERDMTESGRAKL
jgi:carnitine O-acetyltransferase